MSPVVGFRAHPSAGPKLRLDALTADDCEEVRLWRNQHLEGLRTPFPLTEEQQEVFYANVVCDRDLPLRYWAVRNEAGKIVAMVGLTDLDWYAGHGEVSLITDPSKPKQGIGSGALDLLLHEAFAQMGLQTVWGECYECNPAIGFWHKVCERHGAYMTRLPRRKRWAGKLWDSLYFAIESPYTACDCGGACDDTDRSKGASE